jgi:hypothetical protein
MFYRNAMTLLVSKHSRSTFVTVDVALHFLGKHKDINTYFILSILKNKLQLNLIL